MAMIDPGQETNVTTVGLGGAGATILIWLLGYYEPDLIATLPTGGEAAIAVLLTCLFAYFSRVFNE